MEECPICLQNIQINEKNSITVHCCNHTFHIECYMKCMELKKECPLCRKDFIVQIENNTIIPVIQISEQCSFVKLTKCICTLCFSCILSTMIIIAFQRSHS